MVKPGIQPLSDTPQTAKTDSSDSKDGLLRQQRLTPQTAKTDSSDSRDGLLRQQRRTPQTAKTDSSDSKDGLLGQQGRTPRTAKTDSSDSKDGDSSDTPAGSRCCQPQEGRAGNMTAPH
ncbi:hypothetical protein BOX15_Mlig017450g1 [Macrostomum lignano]|uniref:Uncharacterized protein n=1 Tax=Macrostomum lignano TaxID=282301 RepID=A0A267DF54_9PLAT|nr:hypothetical protein BOX15_Mlig017450g1 [Macrostomum lignano]